MATTQPNPTLFWVSFLAMLVAVVGVAIGVGAAAQQWAVAFILQVLLAVLWVVFFYGYRPSGRRSTHRA